MNRVRCFNSSTSFKNDLLPDASDADPVRDPIIMEYPLSLSFSLSLTDIHSLFVNKRSSSPGSRPSGPRLSHWQAHAGVLSKGKLLLLKVKRLNVVKIPQGPHAPCDSLSACVCQFCLSSPRQQSGVTPRHLAPNGRRRQPLPVSES